MSDVAEDDFADDDVEVVAQGGGFENFVRDNPTASVIGAFIAGVILARIGLV